MLLNQELLKNILSYNPDDGIFIWKINQGKIKKNSIAGYKRINNYSYIQINDKKYMLHRLVWLYMTGNWPKDQIDHINHIRDDNRWCNLREVSRDENHKNKSIQNNNKSGFTGVHLDKKLNKWRSQIQVNGKKYHIGYFDKLEDAISARINGNKLHGFHINHGK